MTKYLVPVVALMLSVTGVSAYATVKSAPTPMGGYTNVYGTMISGHRCYFSAAVANTCSTPQHTSDFHSSWQTMHNSSGIFTPGNWWNYSGYTKQIWQLKTSWCLDHWINISCSEGSSRMRANCYVN